jgi:hypothetical protein
MTFYLYKVVRVERADWDEMAGMVICAESEQEADRIASDKFDGAATATELIGTALDTVPKGIVLEDFLNG